MIYDDKPKSEWPYVKGVKNGHDGNPEIIRKEAASTQNKNLNGTRK
jgi:hypothetical protein